MNAHHRTPAVVDRSRELLLTLTLRSVTWEFCVGVGGLALPTLTTATTRLCFDAHLCE